MSLVHKLEFFFFFQAEDGIRDYKVTGVQTCALPICLRQDRLGQVNAGAAIGGRARNGVGQRDRKSTRLNSSHLVISDAVFCLKKKTSCGKERRDQASPRRPAALLLQQ